jgi:hypothetical protein
MSDKKAETKKSEPSLLETVSAAVQQVAACLHCSRSMVASMFCTIACQSNQIQGFLSTAVQVSGGQQGLQGALATDCLPAVAAERVADRSVEVHHRGEEVMRFVLHQDSCC